MDYFEDLKNEELKEFFLEDLNCMNQLIAFEYPNDLFDEHNIIDEHIIRCQGILRNYIINELSDFDSDKDEIHRITEEKIQEILKLCAPEIESLHENANFKTIKLGNPDIKDI